MSRPPERRFTVLDAMILVAACAAAAATLRTAQDLFEQELVFVNPPPLLGLILRIEHAVIFIAPPWLVSFSLAFLILRLRRPRPAFRRLLRQPGTTACLAALATGAIAATLDLLVYAWFDPPPTAPYLLFLGLTRSYPPAAVVGVWLVQAFAGWWRAQAHWIDRLGRVIGWGWVLFMVFAIWDASWGNAVIFKHRTPPAMPMAPPVPMAPLPPNSPPGPSPFDLDGDMAPMTPAEEAPRPHLAPAPVRPSPGIPGRRPGSPPLPMAPLPPVRPSPGLPPKQIDSTPLPPIPPDRTPFEVP